MPAALFNQKLMTNIQAIKWTGSNLDEIKAFVNAGEHEGINFSFYNSSSGESNILVIDNYFSQVFIPLNGYLVRFPLSKVYPIGSISELLGMAESEFLNAFQPVSITPTESGEN